MIGRPRRTVPTVPAKLGKDTVAMLRRVVPARRVNGSCPSLDDAVRELARRAGIPSETFGIPEPSTGADA